MTLTIICAMDENHVIGKQGQLCWHIPEDLAFFKQTTLNHPMIMGRITRESFGVKPLPHRPHIVISRQEDKLYQESVTVDSIKKAIDYAQKQFPHQEIFIIGGADIYRQTIDIADKMIISHIKATFEGDAFFPDFNPNHFTQTTIACYTDTKIPFSVIEYLRKS